MSAGSKKQSIEAVAASAPTLEPDPVLEGQAQDVPRRGEAYYYRSLSALAAETQAPIAAERRGEFADGADELILDPVDRRHFLGTMGASMALAGVSLSGCVRKPKELILPHSKRPEHLIPGKPRFFATTAAVGGTVLGLVVESQEGRPTKVEGNTKHPQSGGATNAWAQASVLDLYDPDRSQGVLHQGKPASWDDFSKAIATNLAELAKVRGRGLAFVVEQRPSPTWHRLVEQLQQRYPQSAWYIHDATYPQNARDAAALVGVGELRPQWDLARPMAILALDCDFLGSEGDTVKNARDFARARRVRQPGDPMNRLYAVDPALTVTSGTADHRLALPASQIGEFFRALATELFKRGLSVPPGAKGVVDALPTTTGGSNSKWVKAVAADLMKNRGRSAILVGQRQPAWIHGLAHLVNVSLGNLSSSDATTQQALSFVAHQEPKTKPIAALAKSIDDNRVQTLIVLGANPAYSAAADLQLAAKIKRVPMTVHFGAHADETGALATWHLPASHYLEAWGDTIANDATLAIQQPLIAPLYDTRSEIELLSMLLGPDGATGHQLVRETWIAHVPVDFEAKWRSWLHEGVVTAVALANAKPVQPTFDWERLAGALPSQSARHTALELVFTIDNKLLDGRYANNAWLQELPDPMTKLTWDNALLINAKTAGQLNVASGDLVEVSLGSHKANAPVWVVPGIATGCASLSLGYGRKFGRVATGVGFSAEALRTSDALWYAGGAKLRKLGESYKLASTQDYGLLVEPITGRLRATIVREATVSEYRNKPDFAPALDPLPPEKIKSLFAESHRWRQPDAPKVPQWGMSVDLTACTGCSACVVACQSENNIPVVGKERVLNGREMHWMRIDRYYRGSGEETNPEVVTQPLMCQHCENAPCETVCPVGATSHSPDGLNDMAYNRCIGTRYCSNNCPYKVRRFNYFNFQKENTASNSLLAMQRNPDVTVRFRGVIEKCTFCVQRIQQAKIASKRDGDGMVPDGQVSPACAQSCPTQAITFGDISDAESAVAKERANSLTYGLLTELNTRPRTTYLAKLRNPNPELV